MLAENKALKQRVPCGAPVHDGGVCRDDVLCNSCMHATLLTKEFKKYLSATLSSSLPHLMGLMATQKVGMITSPAFKERHKALVLINDTFYIVFTNTKLKIPYVPCAADFLRNDYQYLVPVTTATADSKL